MYNGNKKAFFKLKYTKSTKIHSLRSILRLYPGGRRRKSVVSKIAEEFWGIYMRNALIEIYNSSGNEEL